MSDLKSFAQGLVSLSTKEVQQLADIMKEEYGIEVAAQNVDIIGHDKAPLSRQERRKREREAKKREAKKKQKRG